jgi:hypothetical protein
MVDHIGMIISFIDISWDGYNYGYNDISMMVYTKIGMVGWQNDWSHNNVVIHGYTNSMGSMDGKFFLVPYLSIIMMAKPWIIPIIRPWLLKTALPWYRHWDDLPAAGWQIATVRTCQDIESLPKPWRDPWKNLQYDDV